VRVSASEDGNASSITVAVVGICSADHIARCLDALTGQVEAPDFDILVVYDPNIPGAEPLRGRYPRARFVANEGQRNPLELASCAMREATGDLILLTEDHCVPAPDWVRVMAAAVGGGEGRAVVGGRVEIADDASATDWAFYFVDFFRYATPVSEGPSPSLTVCNAGYRRDHLDQVRATWSRHFHETAINQALRRRFGDLWMHTASEVLMSRHVRLRDAVYERYAFGRLFSCTRIGFEGTGRRLYYALFSPVLPMLIMGRMAAKAFRSRKLARSFLRSLGPLTLMVISWSWGEWLGYLTGRHPRSLIVAPEIRAAQRATS